MSKISEFLAQWRKMHPQKFAAVTSGGKEYKFEPGMEAGATVMVDGQPAPDGEITLEDGTKIKCVGGKVVEIEMPGKPEDMAAVVSEIKQEMASQIKPIELRVAGVEASKATIEAQAAKIKALESKLEALEKFNADKKQEFQALTDLALKLAEEGGKGGAGGAPEKKFSEMTKAERLAAKITADKQK